MVIRLKSLSFCAVALIFTGQIFAQKIEVTLDYTITYLLPKTNDTISVSIADEGKYLYSDSEIVANLFKSQFANSFGNFNTDETIINLLFKLADLEMLFSMSSGKTAILMNLDLFDFLPKKDSVSNEITHLVATEKGESISLMHNEYPLFDMYPKSDSDDKLVFAFDKEYAVNYGLHFTEFFKYILGNNISFSMPNGIVVFLKDKKGQEIIRAIKIEKEIRTLSTDLNFYIK